MLTVSPVSAASWRVTGRASLTTSSRAVVAPARRRLPTPEAVAAAVVDLLDEPVDLQGRQQPERRGLVDAEAAGDLGHAGLALAGEELEDRDRPVDRLHGRRRRSRPGVRPWQGSPAPRTWRAA